MLNDNMDPGMIGKMRQRGMTVMAVVMIMIIIAFTALIVMRIVPIYINYFSIALSLEGLQKEPEIERMTEIDIRRAIDRRFDISYVKVVDPKKHIKVRQQDRNRVLELIYEDRRPLIANLDIVAKFNKIIPLAPK